MTTKESKRLLDLVAEMNEPEPLVEAPKPEKRPVDPMNRRGRPRTKPAFEDAPHGERADFLKMTITLSPEVYDLFADEIARRKKARQKGATVSAIIREMAAKYLAPSA